jgi:photosystem II stability/assembly factor-like uncharacterized protein
MDRVKLMPFVAGILSALLFLQGSASLVVAQSGGRIGWAAGRSADGYATILCTTNSGAAWTRQGDSNSLADAGLECVAAVDAYTAWAAGENAGGYSAIYLTTNGGASWVRQGTLETVGNYYLAKISACSRDVAWITGADGAILRTADGGKTWQNRSPAGFTNFFQGVTALDADHAWVAGHKQDGYAPILCTTNGGLTWARQSGGAATNIEYILSIGAADSRLLWAVGFRNTSQGMVIISTNGGATWETQYEALFHANELSIVNTAKVYVAIDSYVTRSVDGGRSWNQVGTLSTAYATMGICVPDGSNAWAASDNWGGGFIYHFPAGGDNWIEQTPTGGVAGLAYISFARVADPTSVGTLVIQTSPDRGVWRLVAPPAGYAGPRCGTGSVTIAETQVGYYQVAFSDLPGFRSPASQAVSVSPGQTSIVSGVYLSRQRNDFDGDGKSDPALYDPVSGGWFVFLSASDYALASLVLGGAGLTPFAADFDGDGKADPAVYDQLTAGLYARLSNSGYILASVTGFGGIGFEAVVADFDGDGRADPAVYEAAAGTWLYRLSSSNYVPAGILGFGGSGYAPAPADYDGDRKTDLAVYQEASGSWFIRYSSAGAGAEVYLALGGPGYAVVAGDFDGDSLADPAVYNETSGHWLIRLSGTGTIVGTIFGGPGLLALPVDFDGDGLGDPALFRQADAVWGAELSGSGYAVQSVYLGGAGTGYIPVR